MATNSKNPYLGRASELSHNSAEYISWCEDIQTSLKKGSQKTYVSDVIGLLKNCHKPISQLTSSDLDEYLSSSGRKDAESGIRNFFQYLNNHFKYSLDFEEILNKHRPMKQEDVFMWLLLTVLNVMLRYRTKPIHAPNVDMVL